MPAIYQASVADLLALDALLDSMNDLQRDSIDRAIQYKISQESKPDEEALEEARDSVRADAKTEYDGILADLSKIRDLAAALPTTDTDARDELLDALDAIPNTLDVAA